MVAIQDLEAKLIMKKMQDIFARLRDSEPDEDYLLNHTIWIAKLSNDCVIYSDNRHNENMWQDLKLYVEGLSLSITDIKLRFRSHFVYLPKPQTCCFMGRATGRWSTANHTDHYLIYGTMCNGEIHRDWYTCPALIQSESDIRTVSSLPAQSIIWMNHGLE